jgi:hypothetical protein
MPDRFLHGLDAEVHFHRARDPVNQHVAGAPVDGSREAFAYPDAAQT